MVQYRRKIFKFVLIEGAETGRIFTKEGKIDWIKIAHFIPERTGRSIYDKYRRMVKDGEMQKIKPKDEYDLDSEKKFYKILHKALNTDQEKQLLQKIISLINNGELVTLNDVSIFARTMFYSPLSLATKAVVYDYIDKKQWPFDINGDINVKNFSKDVQKLLPAVTKNLELFMKNHKIKPFKASLSWSHKFIHRSGLSFKKAHYERRGIVKEEEIERFLTELADAIVTYGEGKVLNMDETFINTYCTPQKTLAIKGADTVGKVQINNFNSKEGTTYIGTISMDPEERFPLCMIASGTTQKCEQKYYIKQSSDYCMHSKNGWTTAATMKKYLKWLSKQMKGEPFALILDVFKAHADKSVLKEAMKLKIQLIFVPACGTGRFQPLDRVIFGILKSKLREKNVLSGDQKTRHSEIHARVDEIWEEISDRALEAAWDIPNLKDYLYQDLDPNDTEYDPLKK